MFPKPLIFIFLIVSQSVFGNAFKSLSDSLLKHDINETNKKIILESINKYQNAKAINRLNVLNNAVSSINETIIWQEYNELYFKEIQKLMTDNLIMLEYSDSIKYHLGSYYQFKSVLHRKSNQANERARALDSSLTYFQSILHIKAAEIFRIKAGITDELQDKLNLLNQGMGIAVRHADTLKMLRLMIDKSEVHLNLKQFRKALDINEFLNDVVKKCKSIDKKTTLLYYLHLTKTYSILQDFEKAEQILLKVLENEYENTDLQLIYYRISHAQLFQKKYINALESADMGLSVCDIKVNPLEFNNFYALKTKVFLKINQLDSASFYLAKLPFNTEQFGYAILFAQVNFRLGKFEAVREQLPRLKKMIPEWNKVGRTILLQMEYEMLMQDKDWKNALEKHIELTNSESDRDRESQYKELINNQFNQEILKRKLESEAKSNEISVLQQQNDLNARNIIIMLISLILLLLIIVMVILIFRQKQLQAARHSEQLEIEHSQLEQKLLRTQMNPHFISNSLTAIQAFILKNQSIQSASYLAKFAKLMRLIIESSRRNLITLEEELKILNFYLDLQKLRFDNQLTFTIDVQKDLEIEEIRIPPMLLQPFIENAVEHGINKDEGEIHIKVYQKNESLHISIEDNGIGIDASQAKNINGDRKSYSTKITKERIENINARSKQSITFEIKPKNLQKTSPGTKIEFKIPLNLKFAA
jgi:hypothetical protein